MKQRLKINGVDSSGRGDQGPCSLSYSGSCAFRNLVRQLFLGIYEQPHTLLINSFFFFWLNEPQLGLLLATKESCFLESS